MLVLAISTRSRRLCLHWVVVVLYYADYAALDVFAARNYYTSVIMIRIRSTVEVEVEVRQCE